MPNQRQHSIAERIESRCCRIGASAPYELAAFLLIGSGYFDWALFVLPCWVLLVSGYILIENLRKASRPAANEGTR